MEIARVSTHGKTVWILIANPLEMNCGGTSRYPSKPFVMEEAVSVADQTISAIVLDIFQRADASTGCSPDDRIQSKPIWWAELEDWRQVNTI
jgi:hypothetical protein